MVIDFNAPVTSRIYETDICIIGSGAAALAILTKLYDSKFNVIVLEAGGEHITDRNQAIYDAITPDHPMNGVKEGRFRVFGGSTTRWGGQALPLDKIDFTTRDWVPFSGWPISYNEVAKHYSSVDDFLNLLKIDYQADIYRLNNSIPLHYDKDLELRFSKWSPIPNIREKYRKQIIKSKNVTLIQNANLSRIDLSENLEAVNSIVFKNFDNKTGQIKAKKFILACGGIENARLLLASNHQLPNGVGNNNDIVGRFLQDHPKAHVGQFIDSSKLTQGYFNSLYINKTRFLPRFILSEDFQKKHKILNASANLDFTTEMDHPFFITKEIYRKQIRGQVTNQDLKTLFKLFGHIPAMLEIGKKYFLEKKVYTPSAHIKLKLMVETGPQWGNRVKLSNVKDELGMPKPIVSFKIDDQIIQTFHTCSTLIKKYLDNSGLGQLHLADWVKTGEWGDKIIDSKHHIGTTRMSNSKNDGVVDTNCKVFDISNLYIAGSSVFPTSGHSNPTFTIIALAFRLAEHVASELSNDSGLLKTGNERLSSSRLQEATGIQ